MLLGSGVLIETVEARVKPLERVLKSYVEKRFTGYVTYRNDVQGVYVSIALVEGSIAGCKSVERGVIYEGDECCGIAMKYLYESKGIIEVHDVQRNVVILDLVLSPLSRVERPSTLTSVLGAKIGIPIPEVVATPITEVVIPSAKATETETGFVSTLTKTKETETKPIELTPLLQQMSEATTVAAAKPIEIAVSNDCIDPVTLYMIMRSSQLLEVLAEPRNFQEIVNKIKNIVIEKKPSYIYVSSATEDATIRMIYDANSKNINIELEKDKSIICGNNALKELENKKVMNVKVWYVT